MKHTQMRENTSRAIMDAFWKLYRERPIEKISVKEICETAGYNRSTFYEYFTDSYSVLEAVEEELLEYVRSSLRRDLPAALARSFPNISIENETLRQISKLYTEKGEYLSALLGVNGDPSFQYSNEQSRIPFCACWTIRQKSSISPQASLLSLRLLPSSALSTAGIRTAQSTRLKNM